MSTLKERLRADLTTNLKAHNELQTTTLRNLLGAITSAEKSGKVAVEFGDAEVQQLLSREVKKRESTVEEYQNAVAKLGERDLARGAELVARINRENAEVDVIKAYLPTALSADEVSALVDKAVAGFENPTQRDFGAIMKAVIAASGGRADGKTVSALVKARLS